MRGCGCGSIASAREKTCATDRHAPRTKQLGASVALVPGEKVIRARWAATGPRPVWWSSSGRPCRREPAWGRCGRERVAGAGRPATRRRERGERKGEPGKEGRRARGGVRARARAHLRRGEFAGRLAHLASVGEVGDPFRGVQSLGEPEQRGARSRPPVVAIVRDRAADLKDPDFTRGATRFAPGVDDTQTYADVRRADGREARDEATKRRGATTRDVPAPLGGRPLDRAEKRTT